MLIGLEKQHKHFIENGQIEPLDWKLEKTFAKTLICGYLGKHKPH